MQGLAILEQNHADIVAQLTMSAAAPLRRIKAAATAAALLRKL